MLDVLGRQLARFSYPGGRSSRANVLVYHRVLAERDPLIPSLPDIDAFRRQMVALDRHFRVVPLSVAVREMADGRMLPRTVSISFDDGYRDNLLNAVPVLEELGLSATVFVATGFIGNGLMWNDRVIEAVRGFSGEAADLGEFGVDPCTVTTLGERQHLMDVLLARLKYLPVDEREALAVEISERLEAVPVAPMMLEEDQLRELVARGMEIGAHTVNHPILKLLTDAQSRAEISDSKAALESILDRPVTLFAYPNGKQGQDYETAHTALVRDAGFEAAFSTDPGVIAPRADMFQLPRFTPWNQTPGRFVLKLLLHGLRPGSVS